MRIRGLMSMWGYLVQELKVFDSLSRPRSLPNPHSSRWSVVSKMKNASLSTLRCYCTELQPQLSTDLIKIMERRLSAIEQRSACLQDLMNQSAASPAEYSRANKEFRQLRRSMDLINELRAKQKEMDGLKTLLAECREDKAMCDMVAEELSEALDEERRLQHLLLKSLLPRDDADERDCILEVRAGTGGEEASLFAMDIFKMYERYSQKKGWRFEVVYIMESDLKGYKIDTLYQLLDAMLSTHPPRRPGHPPRRPGKDVALFSNNYLDQNQIEKSNLILKLQLQVHLDQSPNRSCCSIQEASGSISGAGAYGKLKFECGIHRVQRVPMTEKSGRVHTSAVSVAILPQADEDEYRDMPNVYAILGRINMLNELQDQFYEEVDVQLRNEDLRIDTYRSGGSGGQHANTTNSAVRMTHIPSGLTVSIQDERSQHMNKAKALKVLCAKLYEIERSRLHTSRSKLRSEQIGSGDRSERIRTYNYPQGRVTDHRVGITHHSINDMMQGESLDVFIDALLLQQEMDAIASFSSLK